MCSRCFRCRPASSSAAAARPPRRCPTQSERIRGSCRRAMRRKPLPTRTLTVQENAPKPAEGQFKGGSAYRKSFRQGATLVPRMLCLVERKSLGRLGGDPTAPFVVSRRNNQEKQPWKSLAGVEHRVEAEFLRPVLLGESILPYRVWRPFEGVVPVTAQGAVLDAEAAANRGYAGLHGWMSAAESIWNGHRASRKCL